MSQPLFNMDALMKASMELVFEHFQFNSFLSTPSPLWAFHNHLQHLPDTHLSKHTRTGLVVESGFSFTHVVPIVDGHVVLNAVRRVNVGGKLLTNLLKETLSFRQVNVQDSSYLVNKLKEQYSYLSLDVYSGRHGLIVRRRSRAMSALSFREASCFCSSRLRDLLDRLRAGRRVDGR